MIFCDLETERLYMKSISMQDNTFIYEHFSDDSVNRYLYDAEPLANVEEAEEIVRFYCIPEPRMQHRWILVRKTDGSKMGTLGFHCWDVLEGSADVGYDLQDAYRGMGYMQEAMRAILIFAVDHMHVKKITAHIASENQKSIRLAEKLGFILTGQEQVGFRGKEYPHWLYTLFLQK